MAKKVKESPESGNIPVNNVYFKPSRLFVPVPHIELDQSIEVEQGQERTVKQLYEDYVLGRLDVRDLGGKVQYDPDDSDEVDPMNQFGLTLEESTEILERGAQASKEMQEIQRLKQKQQFEDLIEKRVQAELEKRSVNNPPSE